MHRSPQLAILHALWPWTEGAYWYMVAWMLASADLMMPGSLTLSRESICSHNHTRLLHSDAFTKDHLLPLHA